MRWALLVTLLAAQGFGSEKEAALAAAVERDMRRTLTMVDDPALLAYLGGIGKRLGGEWKLAVYRDDMARRAEEPAALPGGAVFLPDRLLLAARNEAEWARLLAHAMVHVTGRHASRAAGSDNGPMRLFYFGGPGMMPQGFRKIWHEYELEADRAAGERLAAAGYDLGAAPTAEFLAMQERLRERPAAPRRAPSLRRAGER